MIRTSSLSRDTLLPCHYPVVQRPPWPLPVHALCTSTKRPGRLYSMGLTRAISLPERDTLHREPVVPCSLRRISSSYSSLNEDRVEEEAASDSSGKYDSSSSSLEDGPQQPKSHGRKRDPAARGSLRPRNSFLPRPADLDEDEEDEDSDGDNLHGYHEDSSFMLHGNFNWAVNNGVKNFKCPIGDTDSLLDKKPSMLDPERSNKWLSNQPRHLEPLPKECQFVEVQESTTLLMDSSEQSSVRQKDISCFGQPKCPESFSISHPESVSDSSCNSSDGILVNFCAIYSKSNNPATPQDLSSSATLPVLSDGGSVCLNLEPVPRSSNDDLQCEDQTVLLCPRGELEVVPSAPHWSPQGLDSNCNLYSLESVSQGMSSLEASDLTACLHGQLPLTMGTNQKYYKLVTCDLPSKSPSPAWPSHGSCPEGQKRGSPAPPSDYLGKGKEGQEMEQKERETQQRMRPFSAQRSAGVDSTNCGSYNYQDDASHTENTLCKTTHTDDIQSQPNTSTGLCSIKASVSVRPTTTRSSAGHGANSVPTNPSVEVVHSERGKEEEGACSRATPVVRYSKAQRPTSLPIQPFVLLSQPKPQSQHFGSLLDQYISHQSTKPINSQSVSKCKAKVHQLLAHLQPSPIGSYGRILLEPPSSSDTCSTCTPSPDCFSRRCMLWSQSSKVQSHISPYRSQTCMDSSHTSLKPIQVNMSPYADCVFKLNSNKPSPSSFIPPQTQPSLVETPASHYLINLTPEQTTNCTGINLQSSVSQPQPPCFHQSVVSHTPPTLPCTSHTQQPNLLMSLSTTTTPEPEKALRQNPLAPAEEPGSLYSNPSAAFSVGRRSSLSSLLSSASSGLQLHQAVVTKGPSKKQSQSQHCESLILSDMPPTEFCLSPEASYESMSISHLQRKGLLRSVSMAMDLIMAHFGSSRDPSEKMRLGNSWRSPTIADLVLEHLCPAVQNILEDGLRHHKLDVIIGQQRNNSWSVVETSTRRERVLHNLVSKVQQCSLLDSYCMKLRAFIMGLLNLQALEFWLSHLQSQNDVVSAYYYSWAFLSTTQCQCQPLFQELLLLLQPLSVLPFDLNLLLEPRLLEKRELCPHEQNAPPLPPCSTFLMTRWPQLRTGRSSQKTESSNPHSQGSSQQSSYHRQDKREKYTKAHIISPQPSLIPGWWIRQPVLVDGVVEEEDCRLHCVDKYSWSQQYVERGQGQLIGDEETGPPRNSTGSGVQAASPSQGGLRWAKLFGAAVHPTTGAPGAARSPRGAPSKRNTRPSQWLQLNRSTFGLLAQSVWPVKMGRAKTDNV